MKKNNIIFAAILFIACGLSTINAQMISLTTKGEVEVIPDIVSTNISITKTNKDATILKKEIIKISEELNKRFSKLDIDKKDIQTSNLQINKEYNWINNQKVFKGYRANINTKVIFRNLKGLEKIYADLLDNEDITLNGLHYDYSKKEEAENEAYIKALNNANVLAEKLFNETKSKSFHLSKEPKIVIESISNNGETPTPTPRPMYKASANYEVMDVNSSMVDVNAGTITYTKNLTVVYKML